MMPAPQQPDFRQMLLELLSGRPSKDQGRMWAGGPSLPTPPMPYAGPGNAVTEMPKTSPSVGPIEGFSGPGQFVPKNVPPGPPVPAMPPGMAMMPGGPGAPGGLPTQPGGMMPPVPPGAMQPPGAPMNLGPAGPAAAPPMPPPGQHNAMVPPSGMGFRGQASKLFGLGGKSLYEILADTMAGAAAADPSAPPLTAFAGGFSGAAKSRKGRTDEAAAKDKLAYEREGEELSRAEKRQNLGFASQKRGEESSAARMARIKSLIEISKSLSGGDKDKFRQNLIQSSARGGLMPSQAEVDEAMKLAFPDEKQSAAGGNRPPPGTRIKGPNGQVLQFDDATDSWLDEQGNPVDLPTQ